MCVTNARLTAMIVIEPYTFHWPLAFESERDKLRVVLAPWLAGEIEHVGSTAIPGLAAKPVIDIMAPVQSLEASAPAIQVLTDHHYCYYPYKADVMHWFCKPSPQIRTHHLHLVPAKSQLWNDRLAFRNALRASSALVAEYADLKRRLAQKYPEDREAYTEGKSSFVTRVLLG
jgi:GrpB-like predicted nucleotidyltransferase (UPF0157 family)